MSVGCAIITFNEEDSIEECLKAVSFCDEIVVVDSYSTDGTVELARRYTDKVFLRRFDDYQSQKNYAISKLSTDWVLSVDADEVVTPELAQEILEVVKGSSAEAYSINIQLVFLGRPLKFGGTYPDYHVRLFRKGYLFEHQIHEGVNVRGAKLKHRMLHYSYRDLEDYLSKFNKYTSMIAERNISQGRHIPKWLVLVRGGFEFFRRIVLQMAFLDGYEGMLYAALSSCYAMVKYAKTVEKQKQ